MITTLWETEVDSYPVQVIGSGVNLNAATATGLERMAAFTGLSVGEVKNRATITGAIEIGRLPGVVQVTMLTPSVILKDKGLLAIYEKQYG